jgi:t-SNARE complex subunit (syntaxin)
MQSDTPLIFKKESRETNDRRITPHIIIIIIIIIIITTTTH